MRRPRALLVMDPEAASSQFGEPERQRLAECVELVTPDPVGELDSRAVRSAMSTVDVMVTSWGAPHLSAERVAAAARLRAVVHAAGSVRGLVGQPVWERGIAVSAAADANAVPVSEFTFAAVVMAGKQAWTLASRTRLERPLGWADVRPRPELSNYGRTVGVLGFSRIGRRVVQLLGALETRSVLVADPFADPAAVAAAGAERVGLDELLSRSEILTLHAPALDSTHRLIGARELAAMPDGATLINTARGALVDHDALAAECRAGRLHALLDVTDPEPLPAGHPLLGLPNVMVTPHVAGSLGSEVRRMSAHAITELERWTRGEEFLTPVTAAELEWSA
ncbi:hydroxyacid dehydrogenase [Kineosporia succinea]|uniref:Phosphoglycerate dehydrogenase-like enzyme n=1 Tax=Kineosporia succinea TaxID=84632 RepID=A0ABT9P822_9ACTN|nr:hydroxyacid dehydrogenase [Kineosporia succinea]MDP9828852.1 phosphoglycerate dehydrogenase-like enzyme [Kineosporia succinea]